MDVSGLLAEVMGQVPSRIPTVVTASGRDCSCAAGDEVRPGTPGMEARYIDGDHEYAFVTLAVTDHDYEGQHLFVQVAERPTSARLAVPFSSWLWAFYYRGADTGWDAWQLDVHYATPRSFAEFGAYVDAAAKRSPDACPPHGIPRPPVVP